MHKKLSTTLTSTVIAATIITPGVVNANNPNPQPSPTSTVTTPQPPTKPKPKLREKPQRKNMRPSRSRSPYKFATVKYNQWYAFSYMQYKYGWGKHQRSSLRNLWNRESGWNEHAHNGSSGAHGIPQALPGGKMASHGKNWYSNPETQIKWGLSYIKGRYGTPNGAWRAFQSKGWY